MEERSVEGGGNVGKREDKEERKWEAEEEGSKEDVGGEGMDRENGRGREMRNGRVCREFERKGRKGEERKKMRKGKGNGR